MKRILSLASLLLVGVMCVVAQSTVVDNVKYVVNKARNEAACKADKNDALVEIEIPSRVQIKGKYYPVTSIEPAGFKKCKNLRTIILPNTITRIGKEAFWDCTALESVVMPDKCEIQTTDGSFGFGIHGIFKGCKSLKRMRGTTIMYPQYMVFDAILNCSDVPAAENLASLDPTLIDRPGSVNTRFSDYVKNGYLAEIENWQRRKSYETPAQWEARVNEANRTKMINEAVAKAHLAFMDDYAPRSVHASLEDYDSENGIYPIDLADLGTVYAVVPQAEAQAFKNRWNEVKVTPSYGIIDDVVGVRSCTFTLGDKTYRSARAYAEDDFDEMVMLVTPLQALREYEAQQLARENKNENRPVYEPDIIDLDIPTGDANRSNTFAVLIGNENYQRVSHVDFAHNDVRILAKYLTKTVGIPENNVRTYYDATYGDMVAALDEIKSIAEAYKGDVDLIFYYAGHGVPNESNRSAYLLPIDANGSSTEVCYPMDKLYKEFGDLNVKHVLVMFDACFSGSLRGDGMLASARGIKLKPKEVNAGGNMIVLSAASGDQTAYPYAEKNHGLFSYFLIKKLRDTQGKVSLGELSEYLIDNVSQHAITVNHKPQQPTVKFSNTVASSWRDMKF